MFDYLIVGAGFAGSVLAERLAREDRARVLLIDCRSHIAGNAFDAFDDAGILIHHYGPHVFHTNSDEVFAYLSRFTAWRSYEHRVLASVEGVLVPMPINLQTINTLFGLTLTPAEANEFLASRAEPRARIETAEDAVVSKVGRHLYESLFQGYTRKQWGRDPSQLAAQVTARIPVRTGLDDRYFTDRHQAMPRAGYTEMFQRMLDHPNITLWLNTSYERIKDRVAYRRLIWTGPIDEYFGFQYGPLPYRSLHFRFETHDVARLQSVGTINYPNDHAYTRTTEFKHLTGQAHPRTTIAYEYPRATGDPFYPVPYPESAVQYREYAKLAATNPNVLFAGRLGTYRYYNMDQVVAQALALWKRLRG